MGGLFNLEGPLMRGLGKVFDLMLLNFLMIAFCLPIITIGPAITALHYVTLKMVANEEAYIIKSFIKSFKMNFKQGVIIGIIVFMVSFTAIANYFIMFISGNDFPAILSVIIIAVEIIFFATALYIFPLLARFENSIFALLKNALFLSVLHFPTTVLMAVIYLVPFILLFVLPPAIYTKIVPVFVMLGISAPAYVASIFLNKIFKKVEERQPIMDEDGNLVDKDGNLVDKDGNLLDKEGKI